MSAGEEDASPGADNSTRGAEDWMPPPGDEWQKNRRSEQMNEEPNGKAEDAGGGDSKAKPELLTAEPADREADIPRRVYVVPGYIQRGVVTEVAGPGGGGKGQLFLAWAVTIALGLSFGKFQPTRPMRVATLDVEDDLDEQQRRVAALLRLFGRSKADLDGRLLLMNPARTGMMLKLNPATRKLDRTPLLHELLNTIDSFKPDLQMINPLGELHDAEENDNSALRHVVAEFRVIAKEKNIGCLLGHHTRKGNEPGNADAPRGASSIGGVVRKSFTLYPMSEAEAAGWKIGTPDFFFRLDGAKANNDRKNPVEWFERRPIELDNSDIVAAAWPWTPPHEAVTGDLIAALLAVVKTGDNGKPWSTRLGSYDRSIARPMEKLGLASRKAQKEALDALFAAGCTEAIWTKPNRMPAEGLRHPDGSPMAEWKG